MDKVIISAKSNIPEEKLYTEKVIKDLQAENEQLKARLRPLEDSYFKGLSSIEIAELAKKSIRITAENRKLEDALQEIRDIVSEQCQQCFVIDGFTKPDDCGICDYKRILDKINEVIGAE